MNWMVDINNSNLIELVGDMLIPMQAQYIFMLWENLVEYPPKNFRYAKCEMVFILPWRCSVDSYLLKCFICFLFWSLDQMNCAHLENCLHEAREEAQTHLCAADRRASEYRVLRASAVKMRALFERLRACVYFPGNVAAFADSLRALAQSLNKWDVIERYLLFFLSV